LSAIAAMIATSVRGTRAIEGHLVRIETMRAIATALPERDQPVTGTGDLMGHHWRIDATPLPQNVVAGKQPPAWVPEHLALTVQSANGGSLKIDTVRLRRRVGP